MTESYYRFPRKDVLTFVPKTIKNCLDIGCGAGAFLQQIKERFQAETWGIELQRLDTHASNPPIDKLIVGRVEDSTDRLPDNYFDCITFNDVLEHLNDPEDVLKKMKGKLAFNGVVIASIPNIRYIEVLYDLLVKGDWEYTDAGILDKTHIRFFTKKSSIRLFESCGYELIHCTGINKKTRWKSKLLNILTFYMLDDIMYQQFLLVCRPVINDSNRNK